MVISWNKRKQNSWSQIFFQNFLTHITWTWIRDKNMSNVFQKLEFPLEKLKNCQDQTMFYFQWRVFFNCYQRSQPKHWSFFTLIKMLQFSKRYKLKTAVTYIIFLSTSWGLIFDFFQRKLKSECLLVWRRDDDVSLSLHGLFFKILVIDHQQTENSSIRYPGMGWWIVQYKNIELSVIYARHPNMSPILGKSSSFVPVNGDEV